MTQKIILIDYGMGNLSSVQRKINNFKTNISVSCSPEQIENADKLVLPGVGHFGMAVNRIKKNGLWDIINEAVLIKKKPILGICLGMQLMTKHSTEGDVEGFGWFDASVVRFKVNDILKYKVPHMGWNCIKQEKQSMLLNGLQQNTEFYFVHSYHVVAQNTEEILAITNYEYDFVSGLEKENIFGVQFHPEKSHDKGEILLSNFLNL